MIKIRSGQSILEVVIATTLISMGVIAALSLTNQSQKTSTFAKQLNEATAYNNQLADYLRTAKSTHGFTTLSTIFTEDSQGGIVTYCFPALTDTLANFLTINPGSCSPTDYIQGTAFVRQMVVDTSNIATTGIIPITITTSWEDKSTRNAVLNMELTKWK